MAGKSKSQLLAEIIHARKEISAQMAAQADASRGEHARAFAYEGRKAGYAECLDDIQALLTNGFPSDPLNCWPKK